MISCTLHGYEILQSCNRADRVPDVWSKLLVVFSIFRKLHKGSGPFVFALEVIHVLDDHFFLFLAQLSVLTKVCCVILGLAVISRLA